jgi:uncharacterized protein YvpB
VATLVAATVAVYLVAAANPAPPQQPNSVSLVLDGKRVARLSASRAAALARGRGKLPLAATAVARHGAARITYRVDEAPLRHRLAKLDGDGGRVSVPRSPIRSQISAPIVKQVYRNNCETAALSMLLATAGASVDQERLQSEIAETSPLDPSALPSGQMVWGDPDQGFVGRVDGGGPAGGFGVYPPPIAELASRWAKPVDLSGASPDAIYRRLLSGHAVMVWIGLSDGPYETWRSPEGKRVTVNFGEHTVVLTGIDGDQISVNDPLDGQRKVWTKSQFEQMWQLLGRRAVSV